MSMVRAGLKIVAIILAGLGIGLLVTHPSVSKLWKSRQPLKFAELAPPTAPVSIADAPYEGNSDARFVIIEYTDFECPICRRFTRDVLPSFRKKYVDTGLVGLALKHFPLETLHPMALEAASLADCAVEHKKFWPLHDALMTTPLDRESIDNLLVALKLEGPAFRRCVSGVGRARVRKQLVEARSLGIVGTPTFFVGRRRDKSHVDVVTRFSGARTPAYFDQLILNLVR